MVSFEKTFRLDKNELIPIIEWYLKFRLAAASALGFIWIFIYLIYMPSSFAFLPIFSLCLAEVLIDAPYYFWWKKKAYLGLLAVSQLWLDLLVISCAVYLLGGTDSIFSILIIVPILSSSLLSFRASFATAVLASISYLTILSLEMSGLAPAPFDLATSLYLSRTALPFFLVSIFFLTVLQLNYYTRNIRKKTGEIHVSRTKIGELESQLEQKLEKTNAELFKKNKELQEGEEKFRLIFENAKDAIFWGNPQTGMIINCNKAAEILIEKKRNELIGHPQTSIHPPEKAAYYTDMFKKHIEQKGTVDDEAEVITGPGKIKPVHITASVTRLGEESVIQGIFRDITERKNSEERYRSMIGSIQDAILIVDFKGEIVFGNSAAAKMFGFKNTEEGVGINVLDFIAPEHKQIVARDLVLDKLGRGKLRGEYKVIDRTGRKFWVETLGSESEFEGKPVDVVTIRDITQRKIIEEEIIKEKDKLEVLQKNTAALVATHDLDKLLKIIADNARKIFKAMLVTVTRYDEAKNHLAIRASSGMDLPIIRQGLKLLGADPSQFVYKADEGTATKWLMDNKRPYATNSLYEMINKTIDEKLCLATQKLTGLTTFIAIPFFVQNKFIGTFILFLKKGIEAESDYLMAFGNQCAQALDIADIITETKKRSEELEKINKFMIGRELDMVVLKREINQLLRTAGKPEKYQL